MACDLFIVASSERDLYEHLRETLRSHEDIEVIMDRRSGERRRPRSDAAVPERRCGERRRRPHIDAQIRSLGVAVILMRAN